MKLPKSTLRFVFYFIRLHRLKFLFLAIASMVWAASEAFYPFFLKRIINIVANYHGEARGIYAAVSGLLLFLAIFFVLSEILNRTQGIVQIYTFPKFRSDIRQTVFNYVKSHSHEYFANHFAGNLAKKLADLPSGCQAIVEIIFFNIVPTLTGAIAVLSLLYITSPIFAGILLAWLFVHLSISIGFISYCNTFWEIHSESVSVLSGKIVDTFTNIQNVRLFARSQFESSYLQQFQEDEIKKAKKAMWILELMRIILGVNGILLIFGMLFALLYGWSHHWVTIGDFTQVGMQSFWLLGWVWFLSFQMSSLVREMGMVAAALAIIRVDHSLVDKEEATPIQIHGGEIHFENVSFTYHKSLGVFHKLNVLIPAGQKVGLVGFSGSGKSTFVNLILRFYDLQGGRILIDGQNIADVTQDSLRAQIAMIPQDPVLFHRSLMENIRYGRLEASDEEVLQASKLAHCHEFIEKLEHGYQALVGERGLKLSGGQRQRIAIARAILKNAPILILDEATSSLDSVTEKLIQESLRDLMKYRTTIVIAHRLSTLADMDRLLVFHQGTIVEDGAQEELMSRNKHFTRLWNMQVNGFLPEK